MATTAHGYPYPLGTDRVMDGDNVMQALAEKVEARLRGGTWSGYYVITAATNARGSVNVTFPVGTFTAVPNVTANCLNEFMEFFTAIAMNVIATGCTLWLLNKYSGSSSIGVMAIAHQQI